MTTRRQATILARPDDSFTQLNTRIRTRSAHAIRPFLIQSRLIISIPGSVMSKLATFKLMLKHRTATGNRKIKPSETTISGHSMRKWRYLPNGIIRTLALRRAIERARSSPKAASAAATPGDRRAAISTGTATTSGQHAGDQQRSKLLHLAPRGSICACSAPCQ